MSEAWHELSNAITILFAHIELGEHDNLLAQVTRVVAAHRAVTQEREGVPQDAKPDEVTAVLRGMDTLRWLTGKPLKNSDTATLVEYLLRQMAEREPKAMAEVVWNREFMFPALGEAPMLMTATISPEDLVVAVNASSGIFISGVPNERDAYTITNVGNPVATYEPEDDGGETD